MKKEYQPEDDGGPKPSDNCGHMQSWIGVTGRQKVALHCMHNEFCGLLDCVLIIYLCILCTSFISSWVLPRLAGSKKVAGCFNEGVEDKEFGCIIW